jgi:hypothetical protein
MHREMNTLTRIRLTALFCVALAAGCATQSPDLSKYEPYGVVNPWRARWWNYYERGRSFADGGFWKEAEADFRIALSKRSSDQRWARTYGLHFVPEYFPNREMGIALLHLDQPEEGITLLEASYEDQPSARAAYYLDTSRAERVARLGSDIGGPTIELISPTPAETTRGLQLRVHGFARDDTYVRSIRVNGFNTPIEISAPEVEFERLVDLRPGQNAITIEVTDIAGKTASIDVLFRADHDGPAISFDEPSGDMHIARGVVRDPSGVVSLTLGGIPAALTAVGSGTFAFEADLSLVASASEIEFVCVDALGNSTEGTRPNSPAGIARAARRRTRIASNAQDITGLLAFNVAAQSDEPSLEFTFIEEGDRYLSDEISVDMEIRQSGENDSFYIDGLELDSFIPGRPSQYVSRRVPLATEGERVIKAALLEAGVDRANAEVTVVREYTEIESVRNKLSVAFTKNTWEGANPELMGEASFVIDQLEKEMGDRKRFDILNRSDLIAVLGEQELIAAIGDKTAREEIAERVRPVDVFLKGTLRRDNDGILDVLLYAVNTETALRLGQVEVSGRVENVEELSALISKLNLRLEQLFPVVLGQVLEYSGRDQIWSDLNRTQKIDKDWKCVVFRQNDKIIRGRKFGSIISIVGYGSFSQVQRELSKIRLKADSEEPIDQEDYFVITK